MALPSPYRSLSLTWQVALCVIAIALSLAYAALLKRQGAPLYGVLEHGIVTLELPGSSPRAQQLIESLGELAPVARRQVQLDFVFLLLYPPAFSLACALIAACAGRRLAFAGVVTAWAVLLAAPMDAIENLAILQMLDGRTHTPWPQLSTACAGAKFALVMCAAAYLATGLAGLALRWMKRTWLDQRNPGDDSTPDPPSNPDRR
jgi:hypothetical protein